MTSEQEVFVHRFVPAEGNTTSMTLLLLHGTGGDENDLLPLGAMLAPGAALLSPRGRVSENGAARFFRRLSEGVFDEADLKFRATELADFIERAVARYGLDKDNIVAVGYSNGANIASAMMLLRPRLIRGAVLLRPMVPFVPESPPRLTDVPVFIAAGQFDPIISSEETEKLIALLRAAGADVSVYPVAAGHNLTSEEIERARLWLASRL
ncbi:MAG: alpha/beta hydrolase [Pyrinomonadaceae bacterium]|nr:alpha/beta hydrolase [Pyrinomonadaceae bacterium]